MKRLIPSIITSLNLLCGFFAILLEDIFVGSILILIALLFDVLDGLLARMLDVASDVGKELDSFADMISFGLAPAYLYTLISPTESWLKFLPVCLYLVGAAIRLARYNLKPSSKYFTGLPTPTAAFFMVGIFLGVQYNDEIITSYISQLSVYISIPIILAVLMNSGFTMFSLKGLNSGIKKDVIFPLIVLLFFISFLILDSSLAIPLSIFFYLSMSAVYNIVSRKS